MSDTSARRLHPITPVLQSIGYAVQLGGFGFFLGVLLSGVVGVGDVSLVFVLAPAGAALGAAYAVARYLRFEYELDADRGLLVIESGVLARRCREIPLRRIQNVDATRDLFQRAMGVAELGVETAGGGETEATFAYVSAAEADRLRDAIAAGKRRERGRDESAGGVDAGEPGETGAADADAATTASERVRDREEETLFELSTRDLLALCLLRIRPAAGVVAVFGLPLGEDLAVAALRRGVAALGGPADVPLSPAGLAGLSALDLLVVVGVAAVELLAATLAVSAALTVAGYYGFRLARVGDHLRYERGLLERRSGSLPFSKIQTLTIRENAAMRRAGYADVVARTAGYAPGSERASGPESAVPIARRDRAYRLARSVEGFESAPIGTESASLRRPPKRARRRYAGRYALALGAATAALLAVDAVAGGVVPVPTWLWVAPVAALPVAPVAAHLAWANRGYRLGDDHLVVRSGFWRRSTRIVPYHRVQTVFRERDPFQRRWGLASVTADTADSGLLGGDATAFDLDAAEAGELRDELRTRLRAALRRRRRDRSRNAAAAPSTGTDDDSPRPEADASERDSHSETETETEDGGSGASDADGRGPSDP